MRTHRAFDTQAQGFEGAGLFATNFLGANRAGYGLDTLVAISNGDVIVRNLLPDDPVEAKANMKMYRQPAARVFQFFRPHSTRKRDNDNEESSHPAVS